MSNFTYKDVHGTSVINHRVRVKLNLSIQEYVLLDYYYSIKKNKYSVAPQEAEFNKDLGLGVDNIVAIRWNSLNEGKEIFAGIVGNNPQVWRFPSTWIAEFPEEDPRFTELWNIWQKKGNKAEAEAKFKAAIKVVDWDTLLAAGKLYMLSKKDSERQYIKSLEAWLNPKKKHWIDVLTVKAETPKTIYR